MQARALVSQAPPKIQAHKLEINPVEHCNLSCESCSHLSPIQPRYAVDPNKLQHHLSLLSHHYHARWLRLVGGEPLLHPDIEAVLRAIRESRIADKITVVTNGVLLPQVPDSLWRAIDRIDVSQYPGKRLSSDATEHCKELARIHRARIYFDHVDSFRVAYSEAGAASASLVRRIYESCGIVHELRCHTVARGYFYKCPQSYFLSRTLVEVDSSPDRVRISDAPAFGPDLQHLLKRDTPLAACQHCLGTAGRRFKHSQIRRVDFRSAQNGASEVLVDERYLRRTHVIKRRAAEALRQRLGRAAR